jgi:hypothetical protein
MYKPIDGPAAIETSHCSALDRAHSCGQSPREHWYPADRADTPTRKTPTTPECAKVERLNWLMICCAMAHPLLPSV